MTHPKRISSWTAELQNDSVTAEVFLPLGDAFLQQEDWRMGDRIRFENGEGKWYWCGHRIRYDNCQGNSHRSQIRFEDHTPLVFEFDSTTASPKAPGAVVESNTTTARAML